MNVYRFRSMEYLLGDKYQELERQTIYFASPDQLNDPMEGFRDIVWRGDKIVWTNLFKHYVYCLNEGYWRNLIAGDSEELDIDDIPILGLWDKLPIPEKQRLFDDIWHRFLSLPKMPEIIEVLADSNREIRYIEIRYYLRTIHAAFIEEIIELYIAHGLISESERFAPLEELPASRSLEELPVQVMLEKLLESIALFEEAKTEAEINVALRQIEVIDNNNRIIQVKKIRQLNNLFSTETSWRNSQLVIVDFPNIYLKEIERLLWPNWYTACFMKKYHNSSVWGNYGDKHSGACLIFESVKTSGSNGLELYQETGKSVRVIPFSEISYVDKPGEVDFFRSIGRTTVEMLMKLWYTDAEGNISECAAHIPRDGEMDNDDTVTWRKNYWDSFYRDITAKTKDWEYEQEYRLILEDRLSEYDAKESRTLIYDFNSLKGIIFGVKTSDQDKLRIIDIIKRKCREHKRTDFKFFQAYYSPEDGNIQKYRIPLPPLDGTAISDRQAS